MNLKKIFFINKDSIIPRLLYDFDAPIGWVSETFNNCDTSDYGCIFYELVSKDTVKYFDGISRVKYNFDWVRNEGNGNFNRHYEYSWIEGIGSTIGFFPDPNLLFLQSLPVDPIFFLDLLCFKIDGILKYTHPILYEGKCYKDILSHTEDIREFSNIKIYPNPTFKQLFIEWNLLEENKDITVLVIDNLGRVVIKSFFNSPLSEIDLSSLSSGIYFILFKDAKNIIFPIRKITKMN